MEIEENKKISIIQDLERNWKEILTASEEQQLIDIEHLIKTKHFMIQNVDEDDPKLIEFVRTIIRPPSQKPLNLQDPSKTDQSQIGQTKFIDQLLNGKRNGFFIEAGGYDGESLSNSLFFERERDWSGILIEPIPSLFRTLLSKNRKVFSINACIADNKPIVAKFSVLGVLSGRESEMGQNHKDRMKNEGFKGQSVYVPCFSLYTILKALNVSNVDYFSLDLEGGEWSVVKAIPFNKIVIKTFTIEWAGNPDTKGSIVKRLEENNFELLKDDGQDVYLKNKKFF